MSGIKGGIGAVSGQIQEKLMQTLRDMQGDAQKMAQGPVGDKKDSGMSFADVLKQGIKEVDQAHKTADKMATQVATGNSENLHETMLAATQAELGFNLMVQIRNKALEAYMEVMRMPV